MWIVFTTDMAGATLTIIICMVALWKIRSVYRVRRGQTLYIYIYAQTIALAVFAISRSGGHIVKHILLSFGYKEAWSAIAPISGSINSFAFIGFGIAAILYSNVRDITQRVDELERSRRSIAKSLEEKQVLLKEVHHRVKNNMAVISSFLQMQSMVVDDETFRQMINECNNRVRSMALVHEKLYKSKDFTDISLPHYIHELISDLKRSYGREDVKTTLNIQDIQLDLDRLVPLGLMVNEITSNAFKYAFVDNPDPKFELSIHKSQNSVIIISRDNGPGFDEDTARNSQKTLGINIIDALRRQLGAAIKKDFSGGTSYEITFELR